MKTLFDGMRSALEHLEVVHDVFLDEDNFANEEIIDYEIYQQNEADLRTTLDTLDFSSQLYKQKGRQMILADFYEYVFLGRGYYSMQNIEDKENFIKAILYFVNMLMCYEMMTVSDNMRGKFLEKLTEKINEVATEEHFAELKEFSGSVGLKSGESDASKELNKYFDSLLPKTAGGLWHELLVYVFLLRNDLGYIVPLLLNQRLMSLKGSIVPPDFLIITYDKRMYGIEVGMKKEIQSGSFSLQTAIPTATIDTINSRTSDRCPKCKRWIPFCKFIIDNYSNTNLQISKAEIRCLADCDLYSTTEVASGACQYTKYCRKPTKTQTFTQHEFATGLHYHYKCVLDNLDTAMRTELVDAQDSVALKTHYPYYSGLEELID